MLKQQNGPYKIISKLGEGGMANVYLAEKGSLAKKVALKVLKAEFLLNQHIRNRFLSEAKKMSGLNHPNIVGVHDLIDENDFVAIELEYVEGKTVKQHLQENGALPDDEIETLFKQMLDALAYVHENGFVHRDVKPSNFMLTGNGVIKLTDFGIAKNVDDSNMDYTGTGTGMQMGTPKYMSPEQVRSTKDVDHKTDIYSLGVVLWEMVTGKVPYDIATESTFDVFTKIVNEPLERTNTRWDEVIQKATEKDSKNRYVSVGEIVFVDGEQKTVPDSSTNEDESAAKVEKEQILEDSEGSRSVENEGQLPFFLRKSTKVLIALILVSSVIIYFAHQKDLERKEFKEKFEQNLKEYEAEVLAKKMEDSINVEKERIAVKAKEEKLRIEKENDRLEKLRIAEEEIPKKQSKELEDKEKLRKNEENVKYVENRTGTFLDYRDKKTYKWVEIGNQTWMAENLAYQIENGNYWTYDDNWRNSFKYGYLYDWETACKVCPDGWHLPNDNEWTQLTNHLGGATVAGNKMKNISGWIENGNGTNVSGFSGLPGGVRNSDGSFFSISYYGSFWSSTEINAYKARFRLLNYNNSITIRSTDNKDIGFSVRCLKD